MIKEQSVLLTTSRRPTRSIRTLCRDISHTFPKVVRINRGKLSLEGVAEKALELNAGKVVIIDRWKGGPGKIHLFNLAGGGLEEIPPIIYIHDVKLRRDFEERIPRGRRIKSIAFATISREDCEAAKLKSALTRFFGIPILSLDEAVSEKYDAVMQILADPENRFVITFKLIPELAEIGPRVVLSHLVWEMP